MAWTSESSLNFSWRVLLFASEVKNWEHYFFHHRRLFSVQLGGASHSVGYNLHIAGVYLIHSRYIYIIQYMVYIYNTHTYIYIYTYTIYIYLYMQYILGYMGILWFLTTCWDTHPSSDTSQRCRSRLGMWLGNSYEFFIIAGGGHQAAECGASRFDADNNSLGSVANATIASNQSAMTNSVPTAGDVRVTTRSVTWTLLQSSSAKEWIMEYPNISQLCRLWNHI